MRTKIFHRYSGKSIKKITNTKKMPNASEAFTGLKCGTKNDWYSQPCNVVARPLAPLNSKSVLISETIAASAYARIAFIPNTSHGAAHRRQPRKSTAQ